MATSSEEAIALVKAEHEHPELPETKGTRYIATNYNVAVQMVDAKQLAKASADQRIGAGLA